MRVYFDNAATTAVCPEAASAALSAMTEQYGNPSSTHELGREAKRLLDSARRKVASAIGGAPEGVYFTSGGTEADNWAIFGTARLMRHKGKHIITTAIEHDAVINSVKQLEAQGYEVTYISPLPSGRIDPKDVISALRPDTVLVSVMLVNNETGAVNPVNEIARLMRRERSGALLHTDAVQGFCHVPFSAKTLGADLISISGHKIHSLKGVGALYIRPGLHFPPYINGGGQENGLRSGTENIPAILSFGEAAEVGARLLGESSEMMRSLRDSAVSQLHERLPEAVIIGEGDAPHILSISLPGYRSEVLMSYLDREGICVSKSSACKKGGRSHVLEAMMLPPDVIDGALRLSFSRFSTQAEVDYFIDKLCDAAGSLFKSLGAGRR